MEEFEAVAEPVENTNCMGAVVEYKYDEWIAEDAEAAETAKQREESAMFEPNFANENARLQKLTGKQTLRIQCIIQCFLIIQYSQGQNCIIQ